MATVLLGVGSLACSGLMPATDPISLMPEAALVDPWAKLGLPLEGGKVTHCDGQLVAIVYPGAQVDAKLAAYTAVVEAAGFVKELDVSGDPSTKSVVFARKDKKLTLTVVNAADLTTVSLAKTGP